MVTVELNSLRANGEEAPYSYSKISFYQKLTARTLKEKIENAIMEKLDVDTLSSPSNKLCIADLGCAAGPNTFIHMQEIIDTIKKKCLKSKSPDSPPPDLTVFFNDLPSNDFNTLFKSLSKLNKNYFSIGVPGSFHDRLFPKSSVHLVHSFCSVHWLSKPPESLMDENSLTWNKGRVHYTNASEEVVRAYETRFGEDMERFLNARAEEIVSGGILVFAMCGVPHGMPYSNLAAGIMYDQMATVLMEMQSEGLVSEAKIDSFNLPIYAASPEEMKSLVLDRNGCFDIEEMELMDPATWQTGPINIPEWTAHVRAAMGHIIAAHFGDGMADEMFRRLVEKLTDVADELESGYREKIMLFVVLKRK